MVTKRIHLRQLRSQSRSKALSSVDSTRSSGEHTSRSRLWLATTESTLQDGNPRVTTDFVCVARTLSMFMLACEWLGTNPVVHIIHPLTNNTNTNMLSAATCGIECGRKSMSHSLSSEKARLEEHQREARIHELLQSYKKVV